MRQSNAQYHDPELLGRLEIKILESAPNETGWEIFMLDYRVNDLAPLATVFTEPVMVSYKKIFNFLWRLKKIEHQLSQSWRTYKEHAHIFKRMRGGYQNVFHRLALCHHEMLHFVSTIHNYFMVEVLESQWTLFQEDLRTQVRDLDGLIGLQRKFVDSILDKALLNDKNNPLFHQLQRILTNVFNFTYKKVQFFFPNTVNEFEIQATTYSEGGHSLFNASESAFSAGGTGMSHHVRSIVDVMLNHH